MSLEDIDAKTSIEKDLGFIPTRFGDSLYCKFRYSPKDGGTFDLIFVPKGRGAVRSCSFQLNSFGAFVNTLNEAYRLFKEAEKLSERQEAEAQGLSEAIRRLTE